MSVNNNTIKKINNITENKEENFPANQNVSLTSVKSNKRSISKQRENLTNGNMNEQVYRNNISQPGPYYKVDDLKKIKDILSGYNIFKHLFDINPEIPAKLKEAFYTESFEDILQIISVLYPVDDENNMFFEEFIFFGHISLNNENEKGLFEFYMRGLNFSKGVYYKFMINDVTKTKKMEEQRLKEKTLILGKISHEFKNPL